MTNPFSGVITPAFKALFKNMIDALLENTALTLPCKFIFGDTKNTQCPNCNLDTISRVSANTYRAGGPAPFPNGSICPMCAGIGYIPVENSSTIYMAVILEYNRSRFIKTPVVLKEGDSYIQTICSISYMPTIMQAKEAILDTSIEGYSHVRYQRYGDPAPLGFGETDYIATFWRRAG